MTRRQMDLPYVPYGREVPKPKVSVTVTPDERCVDCIWLSWLGRYCLASLQSEKPHEWESPSTCPFAEALAAATPSQEAPNPDTSAMKTEQTHTVEP